MTDISKGTVISHYRVEARLGAGGMGEVYLATDTNLDRQVAIKFLSADRSSDPDARQRFIHEAKAQAMLSHPNIATFHDVGEERGRAFLVMEYVEGQSLPQLAQDERLTLPEILDLVIQIGEGLQAAHEHGVVHRDIKPENVLVTTKRQVKITDFGLARWKGVTTLTKDGTRMGTAYYMSPEQAEGKRVDQRSDLFSLGVILYELVCRRRPFEGETETSIVYALVSEAPHPLARYCADVPDELQHIVGKCLAKNPEERYQSAAEFLADAKLLRRELGGEHPSVAMPTARPVRTRKPYLKYVAASSVVFILALTIFILKPFKIEFTPEQKAAAAENSLAVMYFDNQVDSGDKDKTAAMITGLLITGLSESQYLQVVSRQRLHDILRQLGKEGATSVDKNTATEVAAKAGVKWMITGDILQTQPCIALAAEVSEVQSGRIVTTQRITGDPGEDLFAVTDKLSAAIRNHLSLPESVKAEPSRPVADVTTHSPEAYRYYIEGLDFVEKVYSGEAAVRFQKAVAMDSTFAMAYLQLSWLGHWGGATPALRDEWIAKAVAYADRTTWKEQQYIKAVAAQMRGDYAAAVAAFDRVTERYPDDKDAWKGLASLYRDWGRPEKAIAPLNHVIAIDSLDKMAYNGLAYSYADIGDVDKSIEAINKYIALAPDEPNPYDSRGDLYSLGGRLAEAVASYRKALALKPDFASGWKLGIAYVYTGDYQRADSVFHAMVSSSDASNRSYGRAGLAFSLLYGGRFREGLATLDQGIAADRMEQFEGGGYFAKLSFRANWHETVGQFDSALAVLDDLQSAARGFLYAAFGYGLRGWRALLLARAGRLPEATVAVAALKADIERADTTMRNTYLWSEGSIAFERGDYPKAVGEMERAKASAGYRGGSPLLGRAYLKVGRPDLAITEFEKAMSVIDWNKGEDPFGRVKCYYYLAQAYEQSGWKAKAIEQYQTFLDIWKDADRELPEIVDARARLARLSS